MVGPPFGHQDRPVMINASSIPLPALVPFALMLGAIAVLPMLAFRFWDRNRNKLLVALVLSVPTIIFMFNAGLLSAVFHSVAFDYIPFIILLGSLFIITGGIFVDITGRATPSANTALLAAGTILASFLGTTGAAMLLIRPLLHLNRHREFKTHSVLFFIALVCNCGGLLTPLGDPPLFMMYLRGAPFMWFLKLLPDWLAVNLALLLIHFVVDMHFWRKEKNETRQACLFEKLRIEMQGQSNFFWLTGVVLAIALVNSNTMPWLNNNHYFSFAREGIILLMAVFSLLFTPGITRISNGFTWRPINEVAALFLGIFITMVPCLIFLEKNAGSFNILSPGSFYYLTGFLSAFLDNTPTAVTFHSLALGLGQQTQNMVASIPAPLMKAICTAAVFFGAMTYIGNGPNFMVKTIAEHQNVKMPHFFDYVWKFALPALLPIFILAQLCFL